MKLNKIASAVLLTALVSGSCAYAGIAGTPYVGARGGYAFLAHDRFSGDIAEGTRAKDVMTSDTDGYGFGIFGGYNFTDWFALELDANYFDDFAIKGKGELEGVKSNLKAYGLDLAGKFAYTFDEKGSDVFLRAGFGWMRADADGHDDSFSPLLGIGAQYNFVRNFGVRVGFDYYFNAIDGKFTDSDAKFKSDIGFLYAGFVYTFGTDVTAPVVAAPRQIQKVHTLDAATLFPFNGDKVTAQGQQVISEVVADSRNYNNVSYEVYGYTDRLGSDAYNLGLSQRRADNVASELRANGLSDDQLRVIEGRGKANPVTGDKCDAVKGRQALISCLQPDRRVEIVVNGEEVTTETIQ
ncbi:MAG: outer membrane beta-barrel protein [Succinivibrio sp.]|nr:outer membrane beta-barrel protein [Succinivibrio sp.]